MNLLALALATAAALAHQPVEPGFRESPTSGLLVPESLEEDAGKTPRVKRQAGLIGRGFAVDPWPFVDGVPEHPGYGLNPRRVISVFRESEAGHLRTLQFLYDDLLESDGHLRALIESRISAVSGKGWTIQAGGPDQVSLAAAEELRSALEDDGEIDMVALLEHHLEAPFRGYSASEILWELRDRTWLPTQFDNVAHHRFNFAPGLNELRLVVAGQLGLFANGVGGEPLLADKWVTSKARHSNLARGGLLRTATWWALFKRLSMRDWIVFAERFGIPHVLGYYNENASADAKAALELAIKDLGEGGQAILSEMTKVVIEGAQRSGDGSSVHPQIVKLCDAEIAKLINGATLTVDSGGPGSYALGKVHENRSIALELADAKRLQRIWRRDVAKPFARLNGFTAAGGKPPKLSIQIFPTLHPKERVEIMGMLADRGIKVDGWQVAEQLGFRRPENEADAAQPAPKPAAPGAPAPADQDDEDEDEEELA